MSAECWTLCKYSFIWTSQQPIRSIITCAHCIDGETVWDKSIDPITDAFDDFSLYNECEMNWMFMAPCKFTYWQPSFQGTDFRRWGLWEVIRSWEWSPCGWKSCPIKEAPENSPALHVGLRWQDSGQWTRKWTFTRLDLLVFWAWTSSFPNCKK